MPGRGRAQATPDEIIPASALLDEHTAEGAWRAASDWVVKEASLGRSSSDRALSMWVWERALWGERRTGAPERGPGPRAGTRRAAVVVSPAAGLGVRVMTSDHLATR